ncbi:vascular endothelial growth factor D [Marmota marmota marmota]|uniref:vascular endothelial growth factor D n=1 Tax=Marmota marmota marmota TaxID=9994 RepID=UPI002093F527|nr:vascular endothelial growth factor D [Marmota marmota marmota]
MYREWAVVNIFIMSYVQLVQGFGNEHGPVKVGELNFYNKQKSYESITLACVGMSGSFHLLAPMNFLSTVIDEEWQRTQCSPRETCVEVANELGKSTNTFFKPPCVNVFRCGGCCNEESLICMNTSTSYVSKQLFEISVPLTSVPDLVPVKVANHTGCKCLPTAPRHPYSIIRRSIQIPEEDRCPQSKKLCPMDMQWDNNKCKCVLQEENPLAGTEDQSHLQEPALCAPHMKFDEDRCECVCKTPCPRNLIQHPENCSCFECKESLESCCQKHKIFHPDTCSCEDWCPFHTRTCASGKPACAKHCRFPKEKRAAQGLHSQENP